MPHPPAPPTTRPRAKCGGAQLGGSPSAPSQSDVVILAPGYVTPWAAPGMLRKVLGQWFNPHRAVWLAGWPTMALCRWLWQRHHACAPARHQANRQATLALAHLSQQLTRQIAREQRIDYVRAPGMLVLLREKHHEVTAVRPHRHGVEVVAHEAPQEASSTLGLPFALPSGDPTTRTFDAVVLCAAMGSPALARPLGLRLPMQAVHGYAITFPVRQFEAHPDVGLRSALMDERYKVAVSRLGDRMRVAGGAELGGTRRDVNNDALATLYRVVEDRFPSAARLAKAQVWKGARPMLPDGPPAIGASGTKGMWIDIGHGSSGWALACGSARLLADLMAGREPTVAAERFSPLRWGHS